MRWWKTGRLQCRVKIPKMRICENGVRMAWILNWGKWYNAFSKKNTSNRRLENPKISKAVEIFDGFTSQPTQIFTKLAETSAPLRPLLSQNNDFVWTPVCENAFQQIKLLVENIVELPHFDIHRETRNNCDASHDGLGVVLEQYGASGWHPISFASRCLNPTEKNTPQTN